MATSSPRLYAVYVSKNAGANFRTALLSGVWGVKSPKLMPDLRAGDVIYFAHEINALRKVRGYPRVKTPKDFEGTARSFVVGQVVRAKYTSETAVWRDATYRP